MEAGNERLFRVLGDVGSDLIATAEQRVFVRSPWRRMLPAVACLLVVAGLSLAAAPYFLTQKEAAVPPAEAEVYEEAAPVTEEPALPGTAEEPKKTQNAAVDSARITPKEQLVFWDVVYYVEAKYTLDEAAELLGEELGTVETADQEELAGAAVYMKQNAETRPDGKERPVPLEIFVEVEEGYLYCLTYYLSHEPLLEWEAVFYRWHAGKLDELVHTFVEPMEMSFCNVEYNLHTGETALIPEQQLCLFLDLLQMEQQSGTRTADLNAYLWQTESGYAIPVEDIRKQLSRYLDDFHWNPEQLPGYDPAFNAVLLEDLTPEVSAEDQPYSYLQIEPNGCSLDEENRKLVLTVHRYSGEELLAERQYQICFTAGRVVYEFIHTVYSE